jgi:CheY-like chemotaxis protein
MPSGDGYIVCARLRADPRGRVIPALMLTADPRASEPTLARIAGADDCLLKPFCPAAQPRSTPGCPSWAETTAYRPDLSEHAPPVEQHPYLAAAADLGPHRDLGNGQAEPLGEQEDLDVEGEPVQPGAAEELAGCLAAEALEAALGVGDRGGVVGGAIVDHQDLDVVGQMGKVGRQRRRQAVDLVVAREKVVTTGWPSWRHRSAGRSSTARVAVGPANRPVPGCPHPFSAVAPLGPCPWLPGGNKMDCIARRMAPA